MDLDHGQLVPYKHFKSLELVSSYFLSKLQGVSYHLECHCLRNDNQCNQ